MTDAGARRRCRRAEAGRSAQPARRIGARIRAGADTPIAPRAPPAGHRRQCDPHDHPRGRRSRRARLFVRQAEARGAGPARPREGRQHSARARHARDRRPAGARERHRPAVGVHRRRAGAEGARGPEIRRVPIRQAAQPARGDRDDRRRQGGAARLHDPRGADLGADRRAARRGRFPRRQYPRDPERGHAAAGDLQFPARHDARAGDPAHAAGAHARAARRSGTGAPPRCRSRRRRSSSRSPRSSRRRPASRTSARASPRCSSTGSASG